LFYLHVRCTSVLLLFQFIFQFGLYKYFMTLVSIQFSHIFLFQFIYYSLGLVNFHFSDILAAVYVLQLQLLLV